MSNQSGRDSYVTVPMADVKIMVNDSDFQKETVLRALLKKIVIFWSSQKAKKYEKSRQKVTC